MVTNFEELQKLKIAYEIIRDIEQTEESTRGLKSSATVLKNYLANEIAFYYTFNQDKK